MYIVILLFWGIWNINALMLSGSKVFPILSLILFVLFTFITLYVIYRLIFSFIILIDDEKNTWAVYCIKKSYKLTTSKLSLLKFVLLWFLLLILSIPWASYSKYLDSKYNDIRNYIIYYNLSDTEKSDLLKSSRSYYYNDLKLEYSWYNEKTLNSDLSYYNNMQRIYFVFSYLLLYWVVYMFFISFYVRELKKDKSYFKAVKNYINKVKDAL